MGGATHWHRNHWGTGRLAGEGIRIRTEFVDLGCDCVYRELHASEKIYLGLGRRAYAGPMDNARSRVTSLNDFEEVSSVDL
jgi:hypothetical protein